MQRTKLFFPVLYIGYQQKMWPRLKVDIPASKTSRLNIDLSSWNVLNKENPSEVYSVSGLVYSRRNQVGKQD